MSEETLRILYRDERYIAVDKPSGLLVHKSPVDRSETRFCLQILRDQTGVHVHPCHRLDKPTSGVLLFALDKQAHAEMNALFMTRQVRKEYLAIVRGWVDETGEINHPLVHLTDGGESRGSGAPREAVTRYRRIEVYELPVACREFPATRYSLVQLVPMTGRQHQLRRHMKHIHHPIIGDTRYGDGWHNRLFRDHYNCHRLLLHACRLEFRHPFTGEDIVISSDQPEAFNIHLPIAG